MLSKKFVSYEFGVTVADVVLETGAESLADLLYTASAMRTRMQCVGLLLSIQRKERYDPGTGVVISGAL